MHNGQAIKGGCITWRSHPATDPGTLAGKLYRWQDRVWRAFCRHGTSIIGCRRGRGTSFIGGREIVPVDEFGKRHWRSVAVQVRPKVENSHGTEFLLLATARVRVSV